MNPNMLVIARESRGLTQGQLAKNLGIGQSALSKYENGLIEVSPDHRRSIASALRYPPELFEWSDSVRGSGSGCLYHRKRRTIPVGDLRRIEATAILKRLRLHRLLRGVEIEFANPFPVYDISEYDDPSLIADLVRRTWRMGGGPVKNMIALIERSGGIALPFYFGTRKLDAISQWSSGARPVFFINSEMPWDRIRFTLSHEIGHLVMHKTANPNQESEADEFASAFLMPEQDILQDLSGMTLQKAAELKPYWKVSMQALIRRAFNLCQISESQYRRLFTQLSKMGYRLNEPYPIPAEEPYVCKNLIRVHLQEHEYTVPEMSRFLALYQNEFESEYLPRSIGHIGIVK